MIKLKWAFGKGLYYNTWSTEYKGVIIYTSDNTFNIPSFNRYGLTLRKAIDCIEQS